MMRLLASLLLCLSSLYALAAAPVIDKVVVHKAERRLELISEGKVLHAYQIALGRQPVGHKRQQGDQRTPEGIYTIDWRHESPAYNLSMHLDYPNLKDKMAAYENDVDPGGMIMIHGTPIDEDYPEWYFKGLDWTNGCIALGNAEMREVWDLVPDGTLVEILP
ncbi:MAG: L,D-transpeptidase family protein [Halopseudomonas sp.]|uniref:L,D-transpeptidase family protein n=1 Tax=Halopseudomonas sp. TaxID=2901191 RepID=UPI0030022391